MATDTVIWVDGVRTSALPLPDRGLNYGDGLFETILLREGRPLFLDKHFERLHAGLAALGFPQFEQQITDSIQVSSAAADGLPWSVLRLTVTRGEGPRGYSPPRASEPRCIVEVSPIDRDVAQFSMPLRLGLAEIRLSRQPALAGLKHLNRLEQVLASSQSRAQGVDEVAVQDTEGRLISAAAGNLFIVQGGEMFTPPVEQCGIAGTRRALILQRWAPATGISAQVRELELEDLRNAQEVIYTNALCGVRAVAEFDGVSWSESPVAEKLFRCFLEDALC